MSNLYKNKFVKKIYRVLPKLDINTNNLPMLMNSKGEEIFDKSFDDYYIACTRGNAEIYFYEKGTTPEKDVFKAIIYSYSVGGDVIDKLDKYILDSVSNRLDGKENPFSKEVEVSFYAKDISKFADLLKAKTRGAKSIYPNSTKNLPHEIVKKNIYRGMPKGWWDEFLVLGRNIGTKNNIVAKSTWGFIYEDFSRIAKRDVVSEAEAENYKVSHYIHKIGLWEEFEKYMRKEGA